MKGCDDMAERYDYKIEKDNNFFAGYLLCTLSNNYHEPSLFQNLRIIRVIEGEAELIISQKNYKLGENDIMVLNNLTPRQFTKNSDKFIFDVFAFSPMILKNDSLHLSLFYSKPNSFNPVIGENSPDFNNLNSLLDILKDRIARNCSHNSISSLICAISSVITESCFNSSGVFESNEHIGGSLEIVSGAIKYILENINEPINVSILANEFNISREYFSRIFKKYVGITPSEFIIKCKIDNVIHIIRYYNMNILDAAMEGGFNSSSGFYKAFHLVYKTSPKKFLKKADC